ncbi:MAG TPA: hypothetical protein VK669_09790 [Candidatus Limnocylindrales bacterium]|nr:hypothetical protein [Candidatus Limnocylindrales bacterium]
MTRPFCHERASERKRASGAETPPSAAEYVEANTMKYLFLKVMAVVVVALVALTLLFWLLKALIIAAIVAGLVVGGVAIARLFGRRPAQIVRYDPPTYNARRWR